jgi:hypothetical protein
VGKGDEASEPATSSTDKEDDTQSSPQTTSSSPTVTTVLDAGSGPQTGKSSSPAASTPVVSQPAAGAKAAAKITPPPPSGPSGAAAVMCGQLARSQVCDPIKKTGCSRELGMQCDVDLAAQTLAGVCVFSAKSMDPAHCENIPPTESCEPGKTCVEGDCQKICLCDADCDAGECCTHPLGSAGWKSCKAC